MPNNEIRFHFGPHMMPVDIIAMQDDFEWCTVYCPEGISNQKALGTMYRYVSMGALEAEVAHGLKKPSGGVFDLVELMLIQGSQKRIEILDVPDGTVLCERLTLYVESLTKTAVRNRPFHEVVDEFLGDLTGFVQANREREAFILERLRELDDVSSGERILIRLGPCHYRIAAAARDSGLSVEHVMRSGHLRLFALCYHYLNCGRTIPEPLAERYILSQMLSRHTPIFSTVFDGYDVERILWETTAHFGTDEIAALWEWCRREPELSGTILLSALRNRDLA